jgi:3'-5' exoribonuclease-like protein
MKIWFDTEFIEDGKTIDLISIGAIREDGEQYYSEVVECDLSRASPWVQQNVLPHLRGGIDRRCRADIASDLVKFMGEKPEIWAYYADYDWVALCQLYGAMIDLPKGWPMYCRDVMQLCDSLGKTRLPEQESQEHNALMDAVWTKCAWEFLQPSVIAPEQLRQAAWGIS